MCRKKSNLILFVFVLLLSGLASQVFAIDLSNALKQSAQDTQTATSLFGGKAQVGNLYSQALHIVKQNETAVTDQSVNTIVAYFADQSCKVSAQDVMHILYVSNLGFATFVNQQVLSSLTSPWALPTPASINASYFRFFACDHISKPSVSDFTRIQNTLMSLYYQSVNGAFYSSTLAQDNVGEDLFRNGSSDDSAFDLLIDINTLGDLLFMSFKKAPEVLFYRLPTISSLGGPNGGVPPGGIPLGNGSGFSSTATTGPSATPWVRGLGLPPSPAPLGSIISPTLTAQDTLSPSTVTADTDVQQFLTTNNPSTFVQPNYSFLVGNACGDTDKLPPSQSAVQEITQDPEAYISGLVAFIENPNIDEIAEVALLSGFTADYHTVLTTHTTQQDQINAIANSYAEIAFGNGNPSDGSCDSTCLALSGADQIQCQLGCAKSCIQTCDDLPLDDRLLCVTDCSCNMVAGGQGAGWEKIENMFSIKFCKQPLKPTATPAQQIVTNLEGILNAFVDALQGLKSSGQTIKMKKTKEFLDLGIVLKMNELLDFKILVAFKPIFAQKNVAAQQRKQVIEAATIAQATVGMAATADTDNYNKYVIIADIARNNAQLEPFAGVEGSTKSFQAIQDAYATSLKDPTALYQQQKNALLSEDVINFLQSHIAFWDQFFSVSVGMLGDTISLREKIEKSN